MNRKSTERMDFRRERAPHHRHRAVGVSYRRVLRVEGPEERLLLATELVSRVGPGLFSDTPGVGSLIEQTSVSADGRYIAFSSRASNLVPGDTNNASDVFRYDRQTEIVELVSVNMDGTGDGNGLSASHNTRFQPQKRPRHLLQQPVVAPLSPRHFHATPKTNPPTSFGLARYAATVSTPSAKVYRGNLGPPEQSARRFPPAYCGFVTN